VGHANERINTAIKGQLDKITHTSTLYPTLPIVALAEKLASITPPGLTKSFFTASGTEADETAVMLAQVHTGVRRSSRSVTVLRALDAGAISYRA